MLSMYLFMNTFPAYTKMENAYCEPYIAANWRSLEEAFSGCSLTSSCAAFWIDCNENFQYCSRVKDPGYCQRSCHNNECKLYTKTGKIYRERQHFPNLVSCLCVFLYYIYVFILPAPATSFPTTVAPQTTALTTLDPTTGMSYVYMFINKYTFYFVIHKC